MTLNIIFFSITFKKNKVTAQEAAHQEQVAKLYEHYKERNINYYM
ncbi:YrzI family small protein [Bacillus sp. BRMEA1]|nr:YrzI family small protein [Neobacillus endophyticus]NRD75921.1 YrzI family small protein [Neobacillus endophyticus]